MQGKSLTKEQAFEKLKHYCAYQERCHAEVRRKLFELGIRKKESEEIIASLIEENYLNEERFAINYAGGKWRIKQWGKIKIEHELRSRGISQYCIKTALKQIDEEDYEKLLEKLATKKYESTAGEERPTRRRKTVEWLMYKGYERDRIESAVKKLMGGGK